MKLKVPYSNHARRHLPGGSDPIAFPPSEGVIYFAAVRNTGVDLLADPGVEQMVAGSVTIHTDTNNDTLYDMATTPGGIMIMDSGWYVVSGAIDHADSMTGLDRFFAAYGDATAVPGSDVLLAQGSNMDVGAGSFVRQTFHVFRILEGSLLLALYADLSADVSEAAAKASLVVWKMGALV